MSVIDIFDKYVLSGLPAGAAWDAIKWGWHKATDKSWEQLYVQAFADAVEQLKPHLARKYGGGEVTWNEAALQEALRRDLGIRPETLALGETEQDQFVADLATALAERGFLRIDQQGLGAEDYEQLIRTVIQAAHRRFKRLVESNEAAFKKAVLEKEAGLPDSDRQAVRTWLRQETGLILGAIDRVKEDTEAIREIVSAQRPAVSDSSRFNLKIEVSYGGQIYGHGYEYLGRTVSKVDGTVMFLQVAILNVGVETSYITMQSVIFQISIDGKVEALKITPFDNPTMQRLNPDQDTSALEPGRKRIYRFPFEILRQLKERGDTVSMEEVLVRDEIGNTYRAEISEDLNKQLFNGVMK